MALTFWSALAPGNIWRRALDEAVGNWRRESRMAAVVDFDAALADEAVGIEAAIEGDDLDVEAFFGEQSNGFFRRRCCLRRRDRS